MLSIQQFILASAVERCKAKREGRREFIGAWPSGLTYMLKPFASKPPCSIISIKIKHHVSTDTPNGKYGALRHAIQHVVADKTCTLPLLFNTASAGGGLISVDEMNIVQPQTAFTCLLLVYLCSEPLSFRFSSHSFPPFNPGLWVASRLWG